jgi:hypothetical protein
MVANVMRILDAWILDNLESAVVTFFNGSFSLHESREFLDWENYVEPLIW